MRSSGAESVPRSEDLDLVPEHLQNRSVESQAKNGYIATYQHLAYCIMFSKYPLSVCVFALLPTYFLHIASFLKFVYLFFCHSFGVVLVHLLFKSVSYFIRRSISRKSVSHNLFSLDLHQIASKKQISDFPKH